jgi:two-component system cell cycle sensor histidine kinase/response regulator CckA
MALFVEDKNQQASSLSRTANVLKCFRMPSSQKTIVAVGILFVSHISVLTILGTTRPGPILSELIQLALGIVCVLASFQAAGRSNDFGRNFWRLAAVAFSLFVVAQALGTYDEAYQASHFVEWLDNLIFFFWFTPVGMALFLDPESEARGFDWLVILDFTQAILFGVAAYLYFFYLPAPSQSGTELSHAAFFLRSFLSRSKVARALFGRLGIYLLATGVADYLFYYGPGRGLSAGSWFDAVWSATLLVYLGFAATWNRTAESTAAGMVAVRGPSSVMTQLFPLVYPLFVLAMSAQIAQERVALASVVVLISFVCSSARLLLTQAKQQQSTQALVRQTVAMETSPDGMAILNDKGEYLYVNRALATSFGYASPKDLAGKDWRLMFPPDEVTRFEQRILPVVAMEHQWQGEATAKNCRGASLPMELALASLPDGGLVCVYHDISQRKKIEDRLRKSQRMEAIGKLAGGIAHDFNNLLTVIKGHSSNLLEREEYDRNSVERISEAANRAASLTRQMLAFSRQQVLQPRVINLNSIVADMEKMLRRLIGEDIQLVTRTAPNLGSVKADPTQVEQIVMNLVVNARDAMPRGGELIIETANVELDQDYASQHDGVIAGRYVMLAVTDSGTGMDPEIQAHIFEPFFTTKEVGKGTGLGLSMVYGIVKQSEGSIWVYSEPGKGTCIKVYLPWVDAPAETSDRERRPRQTERGRETILLVEDDGMLRELVSDILRGCGYSVLVAGHPSEAENLCAKHRGDIDLLLTDVVMPSMNGQELAKRITASRRTTKVLYMSGYTEELVELDAGTFFLQKPFTPSTLSAKLREVLDCARDTESLALARQKH